VQVVPRRLSSRVYRVSRLAPMRVRRNRNRRGRLGYRKVPYLCYAQPYSRREVRWALLGVPPSAISAIDPNVGNSTSRSVALSLHCSLGDNRVALMVG
jgi:hypothetical protein